MKYVETSHDLPSDALAFDKFLLESAENGAPCEVLRIWKPKSSFVVLGYSNKPESEVNVTACLSRHIPILRRITGGGAVLQSTGCLNYSLILRTDRPELVSIASSNDYVMKQHERLFHDCFSLPVSCDGHTDLTLSGRKFSGNSQRRAKSHLLFHGSFLFDVDFDMMDELLPHPSREPSYRKKRTHREFLTTLPLSPEALKSALFETWHKS